jgi:tight adherence protein C
VQKKRITAFFQENLQKKNSRLQEVRSRQRNRGKKENGKERAAYEEIRTTCYEMDSGISEAEAYRRFGERCGQVKYKTLATLLIQNLQKGSRHLSDLLEKESVEAWEERKRKARVLGEAAATKLLLPMVLMLLVVMAVIMLPAGLSFYGG